MFPFASFLLYFGEAPEITSRTALAAKVIDFPMKNEIISELQDKYSIEQYEYDEQQKLIIEDLQQQRDQIEESVYKSLDMFKRFQKYN